MITFKCQVLIFDTVSMSMLSHGDDMHRSSNWELVTTGHEPNTLQIALFFKFCLSPYIQYDLQNVSLRSGASENSFLCTLGWHAGLHQEPLYKRANFLPWLPLPLPTVGLVYSAEYLNELAAMNWRYDHCSVSYCYFNVYMNNLY